MKLILISLMFLCIGCVTSTEYVYLTEYQEVLVPQMCNIEVRKRPAFIEGNPKLEEPYRTIEMLKLNLIETIWYAELLEDDRNYCRGE